MTITEIEDAIRDFVLAASTITIALADGSDAPRPPGPYATIEVVSDEDEGPGDVVRSADGELQISTQQRRARVQVSIVGTPESRNLAQQLAMRWRSGHPAAVEAAASGLAPARATGVRTYREAGSSGRVLGASVDLEAYHRLTDNAAQDAPDELVTSLVAGLTAADADDPDISVTVPVP